MAFLSSRKKTNPQPNVWVEQLVAFEITGRSPFVCSMFVNMNERKSVLDSAPDDGKRVITLEEMNSNEELSHNHNINLDRGSKFRPALRLVPVQRSSTAPQSFDAFKVDLKAAINLNRSELEEEAMTEIETFASSSADSLRGLNKRNSFSDVFQPQKSPLSPEKIKSDGYTWVEILAMFHLTSKKPQPRTLYLCMETGKFKYDCPPTGASRVIDALAIENGLYPEYHSLLENPNVTIVSGIKRRT
mmetsp:Transcript_36400/g.55936  ORF Transcript_36400/g.55936 Transcript_36400/m.55936 type:complete len:245 (+) Transcript_36400:154-888(+)